MVNELVPEGFVQVSEQIQVPVRFVAGVGVSSGRQPIKILKISIPQQRKRFINLFCVILGGVLRQICKIRAQNNLSTFQSHCVYSRP